MDTITKPSKKVNWEQLTTEAGVSLEGIPIRTKGDLMWFEGLSKLDTDKIEITLETHIPTPKVLTSDEDKLQQIKDILN